MLDAPARATLYAATQLTTTRLRLRHFEERDIDSEVRNRLNPEVMREVRDMQTREEALELARGLCEPWSGAEQEWAMFVVARLDQTPGEDAMIGTMAFRIASDEREDVEIGYRFDPEFSGRGYATESARRLVQFLFDDMEMRKIIAYCTRENQKSFRLMERLGMQKEALMREFSLLNGEWRDELVYGLLRGELRD